MTQRERESRLVGCFPKIRLASHQTVELLISLILTLVSITHILSPPKLSILAAVSPSLHILFRFQNCCISYSARSISSATQQLQFDAVARKDFLFLPAIFTVQFRPGRHDISLRSVGDPAVKGGSEQRSSCQSVIHLNELRKMS